jgi:hypothetical protein
MKTLYYKIDPEMYNYLINNVVNNYYFFLLKRFFKINFYIKFCFRCGNKKSIKYDLHTFNS